MAKAGKTPSKTSPKGATAPQQTAPPGPAWFEFGRAVLLCATDQMAAEAPGVEIAEPSAQSLESRIAEAAAALLDSLDGIEPFAVLVANARLDADEAQTLALAATAEADANCRRLMAHVQGDSNRGRLTLGNMSGLLGAEHPGPLTVAHDTALRRSGFIDVVQEGSWADHVVALHPGVVWALLGDGSPDPELPADTALFDIDRQGVGRRG